MQPIAPPPRPLIQSPLPSCPRSSAQTLYHNAAVRHSEFRSLCHFSLFSNTQSNSLLSSAGRPGCGARSAGRGGIGWGPSRWTTYSINIAHRQSRSAWPLFISFLSLRPPHFCAFARPLFSPLSLCKHFLLLFFFIFEKKNCMPFFIIWSSIEAPTASGALAVIWFLNDFYIFIFICSRRYFSSETLSAFSLVCRLA